MNIHNMLESLIKEETSEIRKCVLYMLLKHDEAIVWADETSMGEFLPFFSIQNNRFTLIYQDDHIDDFEYIFTDYEEMLIILQKIVSDNRKIYFYSDFLDNQFSKEQLLRKINECLETNDRKMFEHYSSLYSKFFKNT